MRELTGTQSWRLVVLVSALLTAACSPLLDMARNPFGGSHAPITVTTLNLNVRKGPGMGHRIIAVLPRGTAVEVRGEQGGWRRVALHGRGKAREGWVAAKYLKTQAPARSPEPKVEIAKPRPEMAKPKPPAPVVAQAPRTPAQPPQSPEWFLRPEPGGEVPLPLSEPAPPQELAALESRRPLAKPPTISRSAAIPPSSSPQEAEQPTGAGAGPSRIESAPYAESIRPLRDAVAEKRFADAEGRLAILHTSTKRARTAASPRDRFLSTLERASVDLDRGRLEHAIRRFGEARDLAAAGDEAASSEGDEPGGFFFGGGEEEPGTPAAYRPNAFERIWVGNQLALAHLLEGDRRTGEIALAEIDRQQELERSAEAELRELEQRLRDERVRVGESEADAVQEIAERDYAASALRAEAVPSGSTSPFAYYVAGVALELEARANPARREDALAAYAKALELAPANDLFRAAVDDLSAPESSPDDRLVHVLVAEGFVPEAKTLAYELTLPGRSVQVRLPLLAPVASSVAGASLTIDGTRTEMPLSILTDVEAMALRHERDRTPERARAILATVPGPPRTASIGGIGDWFGGGEVRTSRSSMAPAPDPASWMMLPARYYAARLRLSKSPHKLRIALQDEAGKPLDTVEVTLDPSAHSLVYVRSAARILTTRSRSPDWFAAKPSE